VELTGIVFVTHDVEPDAVGDWCRWYDTEHLPEYVALPGVMGAQRYHATPELHSLRGADPAAPFADGRSTFLTIYHLCADDIVGTFKRMAEAGNGWASEGRLFTPGRSHSRHAELLRFDWALPRPGLPVSAAALAHVRHSGIQAALGDVPDVAMRPAVADWYRTVHAPDVLEVPGFAVALRFASVQNAGRHLVLFLLDDEPAKAVRNVRTHVPEWRAAGRTPSPGGAARSVFNGPFRALPPLGLAGA
jgi:hypothetical protein